MAKKKREPPPKASATAITAERAARLYRLLALLGQKPQTRTALAARLKMGVRGFYRDLEVLRKVGIVVTLTKGKYVLDGTVAEAQGRLPFPDPGLTLGEALQLAKGRTAAHRKLKGQIEEITG
jgi:predicted DNA-binding transcriptional regulator YafY